MLLVVFVALMYAKNKMRIAGILEWIMTFIGCGYLFSFAGYLWWVSTILSGYATNTHVVLRIPQDLVAQCRGRDDEQQPLLRDFEAANS